MENGELGAVVSDWSGGGQSLANNALNERATAICRGRPVRNGELKMENGE